MISTKGFKAYDIRGVVPSDVNEELAYALGRSLAFYLKAKTLVIGHDIRLSGPSLLRRPLYVGCVTWGHMSSILVSAVRK